tara:strand:- start:3556 stop:3738 length:183 start_codon:yes stop_codon:yes gene_type:complete
MDYGGNERRRTKKDLKRKRVARGYKRGGSYRTRQISIKGDISDKNLKGKKEKVKKKGKKY